MESASFAGFIRTLCYIALFYYVFKYAMRLLLPMVLKKAVEKAEENIRSQDKRNSNPNPTQNYTNPTPAKPRENKKIGEYVDFEEIE